MHSGATCNSPTIEPKSSLCYADEYEYHFNGTPIGISGPSWLEVIGDYLRRTAVDRDTFLQQHHVIARPWRQTGNTRNRLVLFHHSGLLEHRRLLCRYLVAAWRANHGHAALAFNRREPGRKNRQPPIALSEVCRCFAQRRAGAFMVPGGRPETRFARHRQRHAYGSQAG